MSSPEWSRIEALFHAALEVPEGERETFVRERAGGDERVARRVRALLDAHDAVDARTDPLAGLASGIETGRAAELLRWAGSEPRPGEEVGRYRIEGVVGQGGMGTVYLARDPILERQVALKFLPPLLQDGARLLEEARAASALDHPCIGTVYEAGEDAAGRGFMAMAFYEGGTLRDRIRRGPIPVDDAVRMGVQVADALDTAHAHGIVHRDIKPENLVFDATGRVKVVDFGIARAGAPGRDPGSTGGTRAYMSPEQAAGEPLDGRTDLWSLGVVLHEALTGARPAEAAHPLPDPLRRVIERCLAPDPADRFPTGKALARALRVATRPEPKLADFLLGPGRRRLVTATAGAALLLLVAGGLLARQLPRVTDARGSASDVFQPRGTVVLADFEASPELEGLALAIREALAVDLQQSGFVSVLPRAAIEDELGRMESDPSTPLLGTRAREVAERAGAGAVLETSVALLGSRYALSTRALDPRTGMELFSVRTTAGERRLLGAVERLSRETRRRLGEAESSLVLSHPLPQVTTASLEALRYFAEAERHQSSDRERAIAALEAAVELDPGFAMAHRLAAAVRTGQASFGEVAPHLELALAHRERLTDRERWHIEALHAMESDFDPDRAVALFERILMRFPDDARAAGNLGLTRMSWFADGEAAWKAFEGGLTHHPDHPHLVGNGLYLALLDDRPDAYEALAARARAPGADPSLPAILPHTELALAFIDRDTTEARNRCAVLLQTPGSGPWNMVDHREYCGSMLIALGDPEGGIAILEPAFEPYLSAGRYRNATHVAHGLAAGEAMRGDTAAAQARLLDAIEALPVEGFLEPDRHISRTNLRIHAAWMGWDRVETAARERFPPHPEPEHLLVRGGEALVRAATHLSAGDGERALDALREAFPPGIVPIGWRFFHEYFHGRAHELLGRHDLAREHYIRAEDPRWSMFPVMTKDRVFTPAAAEGVRRMNDPASGVPAADGLNRTGTIEGSSMKAQPRR